MQRECLVGPRIREPVVFITFAELQTLVQQWVLTSCLDAFLETHYRINQRSITWQPSLDIGRGMQGSLGEMSSVRLEKAVKLDLIMWLARQGWRHIIFKTFIKVLKAWILCASL